MEDFPGIHPAIVSIMLAPVKETIALANALAPLATLVSIPDILLANSAKLCPITEICENTPSDIPPIRFPINSPIPLAIPLSSPIPLFKNVSKQGN